MLIRGLSAVTDPHSENVLMASVALQEIVIVSTQTTGGSTAAAASDPANQAEPASTGAVTNAGNVEAQGVGSQAFVGSYNPGDYSGGTGIGSFNPSGGVGNGDLGLGGAVGSALDGLSQPTVTGDVGPMIDSNTGEVLAPGSGPQGVVVSPYNVFGS